MGLVFKQRRIEPPPDLEVITRDLLKHVENKVMNHIRKMESGVSPKAVEAVLAPVFTYCLRAPLILKQIRSRREYADEVMRCLASYASRVLEIGRSIIVPEIMSYEPRKRVEAAPQQP